MDRLFRVLLGVLLAVALFDCGGGGSSTPSSGASTPPPPPPPPPAAPSLTLQSVVISLGPGESTTLKAVFANTPVTQVSWVTTGGTLSQAAGDSVTFTSPLLQGRYRIRVQTLSAPDLTAFLDLEVKNPTRGLVFTPGTATLYPGLSPMGSALPFAWKVFGTPSSNANLSLLEGLVAGQFEYKGLTWIYQPPSANGIYHLRGQSTEDPTLAATMVLRVRDDQMPQVAFPQPHLAVHPGGSIRLAPILVNVTDSSVAWDIPAGSGPVGSWGTLDPEGLYQAPGAVGGAYVTATSVEDPTKSAGVAVDISDCVIKPQSLTLKTKASFQFQADLTPGINGPAGFGLLDEVPWVPPVGSISASGMFTAGTYAVDCTVDAFLPNIPQVTRAYVAIRGDGPFQSAGSTPPPGFTHAYAGRPVVPLSNGKVLVGPSFDSKEVMVFDPQTNTSTVAGRLIRARTDAKATALPDGRVLFSGGRVGDTLQVWPDSELFDPIGGVSVLTVPLLHGRYAHQATLLPDGRVLLSGGRDETGALYSLELFDPITGVFVPAAAMNVPRMGHTATPLQNGWVLLLGGETFRAGATPELFNPADLTLTPTAPCLNVRKEGHSATLLPNGKVAVIGGGTAGTDAISSIELYDPASLSFSVVGDMKFQRTYHHALLMNARQILITGGSTVGHVIGAVEVLDTGTGLTSDFGSTVEPHYHHEAILSPTKGVFLFGNAPGQIESLTPSQFPQIPAP